MWEDMTKEELLLEKLTFDYYEDMRREYEEEED
jgi:hypothetical protein